VRLLNGDPAIVTRTGGAAAVCLSAICTHQGCTVAPQGDRLHCPCHQSEFDSTTGAVLGGPAPRPLDKIAVQVVDGEVRV
jgi:Rieske Fe-S protein